MADDETPERLLNLAELALLARRSTAGAAYLVRKGILPRPRRLGANVFWLATEVYEALRGLPPAWRQPKEQP